MIVPLSKTQKSDLIRNILSFSSFLSNLRRLHNITSHIEAFGSVLNRNRDFLTCAITVFQLWSMLWVNLVAKLITVTWNPSHEWRVFFTKAVNVRIMCILSIPRTRYEQCIGVVQQLWVWGSIGYGEVSSTVPEHYRLKLGEADCPEDSGLTWNGSFVCRHACTDCGMEKMASF